MPRLIAIFVVLLLLFADCCSLGPFRSLTTTSKLGGASVKSPPNLQNGTNVDGQVDVVDVDVDVDNNATLARGEGGWGIVEGEGGENNDGQKVCVLTISLPLLRAAL